MNEKWPMSLTKVEIITNKYMNVPLRFCLVRYKDFFVALFVFKDSFTGPQKYIMEMRSPIRWIYGWSGISTPVVGSCLSHYIDVYLPCGVWVVWSVGGPWKPPLASTHSCPSSLGRLTQVHCPDSKSQLPGGLQAPSLTEISSNLTVDLVPGPWTAWNTTWWMTWNAF